jgi:hypothetical protein
VPHRRSRLTALHLLTLACLFATPASAHYREACWAHFRYTAGWSGTIAATCQYATGAELNEHFRTKRFENYKGYATIILPGVRTITVRISEPLRCGFVAEDGCAEQLGHRLTGRDRLPHYRHGKWIKRQWEICQPGIMGVCTSSTFWL